METSRQKTVTFEFHSTDITPEEMANTFISEDLLAEQHRGLLVEQLIDIAKQLTKDPQTIPQVTFPPDDCLLSTRENRFTISPCPGKEQDLKGENEQGEANKDKKEETNTETTPPSEKKKREWSCVDYFPDHEQAQGWGEKNKEKKEETVLNTMSAIPVEGKESKMPISFKVTLTEGDEKEIRRFLLPAELGRSFSNFKQKIAAIFPSVQQREPLLSWIDEDGDEVRINNNNNNNHYNFYF